MFEYSICNQADESIFEKQCLALEKNISCIKKGKLLIDVDDSKIQEYQLEGKIINVVNSYYTNEVYIEAEIDIVSYFK